MMKSAKGLIDYAIAQIGRPYWLGGFGQKADRSLYDQNKSRLGYGSWEGDYEKHNGQKVHDCCGLVKGYCWTDGPDVFWKSGQYQINECGDWGVATMYARCSETGTMNTIPAITGILVFTKNYSHMGVYDGNGYVIEARGHAYGVQKNKLSERSFTKWGKASWLTYNTETQIDYSWQIKKFQMFLNTNYKNSITLIMGKLLDIDGRCGPATKMAAVIGLQNELNRKGETLSIDGRCGPATRSSLSQNMVKKGISGNMAYIVQGLLYGAGYECNGFDGSVGDGCNKAIRAYQKDNNLKVDGKVGGETFVKLVS